MNINEHLADIERLAWRHFPQQFDGTKRAKFHIEQLEKLIREMAFRQEALDQLKVYEMRDEK